MSFIFVSEGEKMARRQTRNGNRRRSHSSIHITKDMLEEFCEGFDRLSRGKQQEIRAKLKRHLTLSESKGARPEDLLLEPL